MKSYKNIHEKILKTFTNRIPTSKKSQNHVKQIEHQSKIEAI